MDSDPFRNPSADGSFPRKRESSSATAYFQWLVGWIPTIAEPGAPAFAGMTGRRRILVASCVAGGILFLGANAAAQENYEIQVYSFDLVQPHHTMVELHSNFTFEGSKDIQDGVRPTEHALHETIEITHGFTPWFETGFYIFTSSRNGDGVDWVGDHIRPRLSIPAKWRWPVGLSISNEIGYQRHAFSADTWTWEIRPIIDKKWGRWYASFNPTFDRSLHGPSVNKGFEFSPNFKFSYDITPKIAMGLEYYGALGPVTGFDPLRDQQQQIFPTIDLNLSPRWEFNFGVGVGATRSTDHLIAKMILGYRFDF